jgi:hypothetical protein
MGDEDDEDEEAEEEDIDDTTMRKTENLKTK